MNKTRLYHTLTALPDGKVLAMGGAKSGQYTIDNETDYFKPEVIDGLNPTGWSLLSKPSDMDPQEPNIVRGYHGTALLLPSGDVVLAGGEPETQDSEQNPKPEWKAQVFSPPYGGSNSWKTNRPTITACPTEVRYGETVGDSALTVSFAEGRTLETLVMISLGATTHAFNENQRWVQLYWTGSATAPTMTPPTSPRVAPPGYYMLFAVDDDGVPSEAKVVRLRDYAPVYIPNSGGSFNVGTPALTPAYGSSLFLNDNFYLGGWIDSSGWPNNFIEIELWGNHTTSTARRLRLSLEGKTSTNTTLYVYLYNWDDDQFDQVATSSWTANNEVAEAFFTSDDGEQSPHPYIRSSDKKVHVKLLWVGGTTTFQGRFDLAEFGVR